MYFIEPMGVRLLYGTPPESGRTPEGFRNTRPAPTTGTTTPDAPVDSEARPAIARGSGSSVPPVESATTWVLTQDHLRLTVYGVPLRRTPLPAWVLDHRRELGQRINFARRPARLSQDDLANIVGVERRTIQRYEGGVRDPKYSDLLLIARALDIPLSDLVRE